MKSRPLLARISSVLGIAIGIAGVAFVTRTLISKWDEVSDAFSQVDAINLVLSLLLGLAAMTSIGWIWVTMIVARSHNVRHRNAMSWYFTGQLGKYVPGGIWPIVGRAELAVRNGIPRLDAYASTGLSLVTTYAAAVVTIGIGALRIGRGDAINFRSEGRTTTWPDTTDRITWRGGFSRQAVRPGAETRRCATHCGPCWVDVFEQVVESITVWVAIWTISVGGVGCVKAVRCFPAIVHTVTVSVPSSHVFVFDAVTVIIVR